MKFTINSERLEAHPCGEGTVKHLGCGISWTGQFTFVEDCKYPHSEFSGEGIFTNEDNVTSRVNLQEKYGGK